jgi:putative salt-induced outer membrane protein YdiY
MTTAIHFQARNRLYLQLFSLFLISGLFAGMCHGREKQDIVIFDNGDKVTCEIKDLQDGILTCSTVGMGTADIEWNHVQSLSSTYFFRYRLADGNRYFGSMAAGAPPGKLRIVHAAGATDVDIPKVVAIYQVESDLLDRLESRVSLGFSDYKTNSTTTLNLGVNVSYADDYSMNTLDARSVITKDRIETKESRRIDVVRERNLKNPKKFFYIGSTYESNDELAIDYRLSFSSGMGRRLIESHRTNLRMTLGAQVLTEQDSLGEETNSVEGVVAMRFKTWHFDSPELDWTANVQVYPGITETGRVRSDFDTKLSWEIWGDFYWNINAYGSFDNESNKDGSDFDYGITTGIDWKL